MFKDLSPNLKSSITRSITQTFEQYMSDIGWSGEKFSIDDYIASGVNISQQKHFGIRKFLMT